MAWTSEQLNYLWQNRHLTCEEIAKNMGKSYDAIRKMSKRHGISLQKKVRSFEKRTPEVKNDEIDTIFLLKQGKSAMEIAEIYGVKYGFIVVLIEKQLQNLKIQNKKGRIIPEREREADFRKYWNNEDEIFRSIDPVYDPEDLQGEEKAIFDGRIKTEGQF